MVFLTSHVLTTRVVELVIQLLYLMGGGLPGGTGTSNIHKITFVTGGYETLNPMSQEKEEVIGTGPRSNDFSSPSPVNC